jgi:phospholipid transport system substrate-binding protein
MITRRPLLICAALALAVSLTSARAFAAGADDFIRAAGARTFESLAEDMTDDQRAARFRNILTETFDLPTIARFTLGRFWRIASAKQKTEYVHLFEEFIVQAYSNRFKDLSGRTFEVKLTRVLNARDQLVLSEIRIEKGKPPIRVNWRVRLRDSAYRVIDVMVEGVSMSVTQRDEFAAVIRRNGGKIEGLLSALRRKTGQN